MPSTVEATLWSIAPGTATRLTAEFLEVELQADAEHQEDDANLGELLSERFVRDEPRRVGSDEHPGHQVPHDRRQAEALGHVAEDERRGESTRERCDQSEIVHPRKAIGRA